MPNNSLQRSCENRGRTVRAVALCARAGAYGALCPAAELNRDRSQFQPRWRLVGRRSMNR